MVHVRSVKLLEIQAFSRHLWSNTEPKELKSAQEEWKEKVAPGQQAVPEQLSVQHLRTQRTQYLSSYS